MGVSTDEIEFRGLALATMVITTFFGLVGIILHLRSMLQVCGAKIKYIRTDFVHMIHFFHILITLGLIFEAFFYTEYFVLDLIIEVLLSATCAIFYMYMKEWLALFAFNHLQNNPELKRAVITNPKHEEIMFRDNPPFESFRFFKRLNLTDYYTGYWYVINGFALRFFFWKKPIKDYSHARPFTRRTNILLTLYFLIVPILMGSSWGIIEFHNEEEVTIAGSVKVSTILNILTAIITLSALPKISMFSKSFKAIFPFFNWGHQLHTVLTIRVIRKVILIIIGIIQPNLDEFEGRHSTAMIYLIIFSIIFWANSFFMGIVFSPHKLTSHERSSYDMRVSQKIRTSIILGDHDDSKDNLITTRVNEKSEDLFLKME